MEKTDRPFPADEVDARCAAMLRRALEAIYPQNNYTPEARTLANYLDRIRATLPPSPQETQGQERCAGYVCGGFKPSSGSGWKHDNPADWNPGDACSRTPECHCANCHRPYSKCLASRTQASQSAAAELHEHCEHGRAKVQCMRCSPVAAAPATVAQPVSASGREAGRPPVDAEDIVEFHTALCGECGGELDWSLALGVLRVEICRCVSVEKEKKG